MSSNHQKVTAFTGAQAQKEALEVWRAKAAAHSAKVCDISKKVTKHKKQAQRTSQRRRWLADRDAVNKEQDACEEQLTQALHPLLPYLQEDLVDGASRRQSLRDTIHETLERVNGCSHVLARSRADPGHTTGREAALQMMRESLDSLRAFLARTRHELDQAESEEAGQSPAAERARGSTASAAVPIVDVPSMYEETRQQCIALRSAYPGHEYEAIHDAFEHALLSEETRCSTRMDEIQAATTASPLADFPAVTPRVIASVSLLVKMSESARRTDAAAASSREVADRVAQSFPQLNRHEIRAALEECQRQRRSRQAQRHLALSYRKETNALFSTYTTALAAHRLVMDAEREKAAERAAREAKQADMHEHLAERRVAFEELQHMRQAEEERKSIAEQRRREAAQAAQMQELQERLGHLAAYMHAREEARQRESAIAAARANEEAARKADEMEANRQRVAYRQRQTRERQEQHAAREQELRLLQEAKEAALAKFFASVDQQLAVQPSRERLLQATEASKQTMGYVPLAQETAGVWTAARGGYSDDQIMKDPRVRLYHALLEAGLHTTPYGREVASRGFRVAPAQRPSEDSPFV